MNLSAMPPGTARVTDMNALLLVDLQNDFLPGGPLPVPEGDAVIPVANGLMARFDLVIATQDWHPPGHKSFASSHEGRKPGDVIELHGREQVLWPDHCVQGTPGAELVAGLDFGRIDRIVQKGADPEIDSYSGFFDADRRNVTGLADFLAEQGAWEVYVLGLATDYCVKFTALDARQLGLATYLIEDGCRGVDLAAGDVARAVGAMREAGVIVLDSSRVPRADWR
jgi:nicotinamidase/pyrazinamidase